MSKKALTILGAIFILIIGVVGFLLYQQSSSGDVPPPPPVQATPPPPGEVPPPNSPAGGPPPAGTLPPPPSLTPSSTNATKLTTSGSVVSPVLFYQGNGVTYFNTQGQLFQADLEFANTARLANIRELTVPLKTGVQRILWPQAGNNYIVQYTLGDRTASSVYVADRGEYVDLPQEVISIGWSPLGDKIVYVWLDGNNKATLNVANPDNTGYQVITDFWEPDNAISISPDGKNILFYQTKNQQAPNKINIVTADGKVFKTVVAEGFNTGALWSPDSKRFLFLKREEGGERFQLWTANALTGELKNLEVYTTLDKVAWGADSQMVYAASAGISGDTINKISLTSDARETLNPGMQVDANSLFLSSTQDWLFFKNQIDGELYSMPVSINQ